MGVKQDRKPRKFQFVNTHDIDNIWLFEKWIDYITKLGKVIVTQKNFDSLIHQCKLTFQSLVGQDPYLVFDYFMDLSERSGILSHFFFMAGGSSSYDNGYDIRKKSIRKIIDNVIDRGHVVGIHPSYNTLNNPQLLSSEIEKLREISGENVICGRQHYLRFEVPHTWQHWEDNNMQWDSSLGYSQKPGFRCGVCYPYPVFNILTRKQLKLVERPLVIM